MYMMDGERKETFWSQCEVACKLPRQCSWINVGQYLVDQKEDPFSPSNK